MYNPFKVRKFMPAPVTYELLKEGQRLECVRTTYCCVEGFKTTVRKDPLIKDRLMCDCSLSVPHGLMDSDVDPVNPSRTHRILSDDDL